MFGKAQGVGEQNLQMYISHIIIIRWSSVDAWNGEKFLLKSVQAN